MKRNKEIDLTKDSFFKSLYKHKHFVVFEELTYTDIRLFLVSGIRPDIRKVKYGIRRIPDIQKAGLSGMKSGASLTMTLNFSKNKILIHFCTLYSLERNYKYELLTEHDLGVAIDLILPETYEVDLDVSDKLDPADEKLLEEELNTAQDKRRNMKHSQVNYF
jgi:hypothetical protein